MNTNATRTVVLQPVLVTANIVYEEPSILQYISACELKDDIPSQEGFANYCLNSLKGEDLSEDLEVILAPGIMPQAYAYCTDNQDEEND